MQKNQHYSRKGGSGQSTSILDYSRSLRILGLIDPGLEIKLIAIAGPGQDLYGF